MNWTRQVVHVARKDLTHVRWLLGLYALLLLAALVIALTDVAGMPVRVALYVAPVLMAMIVVAPLVHEESPTVESASWRSRPLHPLAVFAGKVAIVLLLLLIAISAQAAAALGFQVTTSELGTVLWESIWPSALWLLWALLLAAITRDFKSYVIASLVAAFALFWPGQWLLELLPERLQSLLPWNSMPVSALRVVMVLMAAVFLMVVYLRRIAGWPLRVALVPCLCVIVEAQFQSDPPRVNPPMLAEGSLVTATTTMTVRLVGATGRSFTVRLDSIIAPSADRVVWDAGYLTIEFPNGEVSRLPLMAWRGESRLMIGADGEPATTASDWLHVIRLPQRLPGDSIAWPGDGLRETRASATLDSTTPAQRAAIDAGAIRARVEGTVLLHSASTVARIPNRDGAKTTAHAIKLARKDKLTKNGIVETLRIQRLIVPSRWRAGLTEHATLLVNRLAHDAIDLGTLESDVLGSALAIPGVSTRRSEVNFQQAMEAGPLKPPRDAAWRREAEVVVIGWTNPRLYRFETTANRIVQDTTSNHPTAPTPVVGTVLLRN